jgi:hypothetical protein
VLDNFAADPWTGEAMVATAEAVAREGGFSRDAVDAVTLLRYRQYARALEDDRAFQRRTLQPVAIGEGKRRLVVDADDGVHDTTADGLAALAPTVPGGVVTFGSQTHPADGAAGCVVLDGAGAGEIAAGAASSASSPQGSRVPRRRAMPKAATTAAVNALADAGLSWRDVAVVNTHNPFAINDLWFAQQTGFALEDMNPFGCSLVYGHPQAPTGLRASSSWSRRCACAAAASACSPGVPRATRGQRSCCAWTDPHGNSRRRGRSLSRCAIAQSADRRRGRRGRDGRAARSTPSPRRPARARRVRSAKASLPSARRASSSGAAARASASRRSMLSGSRRMSRCISSARSSSTRRPAV